ncbi:hypothetical protein [Ornithinicoccus halotolerans]|uniref:hypothetical protein n=1 Tax=Ornithinicoccus halotolerans TaxID=1748220 RepID=UPI0018861A5E|nr:hypothetical protein [Ornithinicoccus halotolerans]
MMAPVGAGRRVAVAAAALVLIGGCGSGALRPPGQADDPPAATSQQSSGAETTGSAGTGGATGTRHTPGAGGGTGDAGDDDGELFSFGLPEGPSSIAGIPVDDVYIPLAAGRCAQAQTDLDLRWEDFESPRTVLLYQAGISLCLGDEAAARDWLARAGELGWSGVGREVPVVNDAGVQTGTFRYDCELYRSLVHVLARVPRDSVSCPDGEAPPWSQPGVDPRLGTAGPATTATGDDTGTATDSGATDTGTTDTGTTDTGTTDTGTTDTGTGPGDDAATDTAAPGDG